MTGGEKIKYHRKKKNWTQEELANKVSITSSYLSKIENGREPGTQEIIEALYNQLGIKEEQKEDETLEIRGMIDEWYSLLKKREMTSAKKLKKLVEGRMKTVHDPELMLYFQIIDLRHQLGLHDFKNAQKSITEIQKGKDLLTPNLRYFYYQFTGLYAYEHYDCEDALDAYKKAEDIAGKHHLETEPEFYYYMSINYSRLHYILLALEYAREAFKTFNFKGDVERAVDCRILIGTNLKRFRNYQEAENEFLYTLETTEKFGFHHDEAIILHNLGCLFSCIGDHKQAISYFHKSYGIQKEKGFNPIDTIYNLAEEYALVNNLTNAQNWVEIGMTFLKNDESKSERNEILLRILQHEVCQNKGEDYATYLSCTALTFFREKGDWVEECRCLEKLASYHSANQHYKQSYEYIFKANELRKQYQPF